MVKKWTDSPPETGGHLDTQSPDPDHSKDTDDAK